jgi:hypothetical protein
VAGRGLDWKGFLLRWLAALLLVFAVFNPTGLSYFHWIADGETGGTHLPLKILVGLLLLGGFAVYLRATWISLGLLGIALVVAVLGVFVWLLVDYRVLDVAAPAAASVVIQLILSVVMAVGMSWSHVQRRLSGQVDVDDEEEE